jgi:hypothetical protein
LEHRRFTEFCEACRRYGYIGLCYGPPGGGKTLSARSYSRWNKVKQSDRWSSGATEDLLLDTVFYTPSVVNAPNTIQADIRHCRDTLRDLAKRPLRQEKEGKLDAIRRRDDEHQAKILLEYDWFSGPIPEPQPTYGQVAKEYSKKELQINDPTTLILIDERTVFEWPAWNRCVPSFILGSGSFMSFGPWEPTRYANYWSGVGRPQAFVFRIARWSQRWSPPSLG